MVTFGLKSGICGFYSTHDFRLNAGDEALCFKQNVESVKLLNFGLTWKHIQKKNLLTLVGDTSTFLKIELARVNQEVGIAQNIRGYGTFIGFDVPNEKNSEQLQKWLFINGINLLRCGPLTFGLRPALILGPKHAAYLRDVLFSYNQNFRA
jgi:4-aminobutyrate aminotransferase-like enzyme